jgi:quinol monooxygenase YgiN
MYGTVARIKPKPGMDQAVIQSLEEWQRDRRPKVKGAIGGYLYRLDKGGLMMVAVFESKEAYIANAEDPAQDQWYQTFRALLETDPEWNDGEVVPFA